MGIIAHSLSIGFVEKNIKSKTFLRIISPLCIVFFFFLLISILFAGEAERLLSLVDYMGGDYKNAVKGGKIIDEREYEEMVAFSSDVVALFSELKASGGDKAG